MDEMFILSFRLNLKGCNLYISIRFSSPAELEIPSIISFDFLNDFEIPIMSDPGFSVGKNSIRGDFNSRNGPDFLSFPVKKFK